MPDELRERLREAAEESGRSTNAEIVARLEESFGKVAPLKREEIVQIVRTTIEEWKAAEGGKE